jgi:signal transduction histidine kinase
MSSTPTAYPAASVATFYRSIWGETEVLKKSIVVGVVGYALLAALLLATGLLEPSAAAALSAFSTVATPAATGILFIWNGAPHGGRAGLAWSLIGGGLIASATGEFFYQTSPGSPFGDIGFLVVYPLLLGGVLLLPHLGGRRWERLRLTLDAVAGAIAMAAIAWVAFLEEALLADRAGEGVASVANLLYPIGDAALLIALIILAARRSAYQFDGRLVTLWLALMLSIAANAGYALQIESGTYFVGSPLDSLWLVSFGFAAVTTLFLARPQRYREVADRTESVWTMIAPYSMVAILFVLTSREVGTGGSALQIATMLVVALIIARQGVAIRETREVVEKQRTDLVASISHELRTPLAAIGGFVEIMAEDADIERDERIEMLDMVRDQTRHLTGIVEDMVDISRGRLSSASIERAPVNAARLVAGALDIVPDLTVDITLAVCDEIVLIGDENRLRQVVVNYLVNACRYGGDKIVVRCQRRGDEAIIEVHDNGPGVPKKHEITIWDRFERGPHTYTSTVQGSGLGLAIVRQLAIAHGGQAGYRRSELLGGACFWLSVPSDLSA